MIASPTSRTIYRPRGRNILDLYNIEGDGLYNQSNYVFVYKSTVYFSPSLIADAKSICSDDNLIEQTTINGDIYTYLPNVLKIVLGYNNSCIIYRNGDIDINGVRSNYKYIRGIMPLIRDTFTPSSYVSDNSQYKQLFLLENGDLVVVDCYNKTNSVILTDVSHFLAKNQGRRSDGIVAMRNGETYHVWVGPTPNNSNYYDGNETATGVLKINGLNHNYLKFCTIGDSPASTTFCRKDEPNKIFRFIRGYGANFKITGFNTSPIDSMTLTDTNDYYIDGKSQEFNSMFLTNNKIKIRSTFPSSGRDMSIYTRSEWDYEVDYDPYSFPDMLAPRKILTPNAMSMMIEDKSGRYWLCDANSGDYHLKSPVRYDYFNTLKRHLDTTI